MISQFQVLVSHFNKGVGQRLNENGLDLPKLLNLRISLIDEEVKETVEAMQHSNAVSLIDGLCDVLYVTYGAADVFDIELDTLREEEQRISGSCDWPEIHRSAGDLTDEANRTMAAIRKYDLKEMGLYLQKLAEGCWDCAAQGLGIDMRPFFLEVHRTNMWKLKGPKREDGKQLKPEGWKPPRLEAMYNRLVAGNPPHCFSHRHPPQERHPHPGGGEFCGACGGLLVNVES